MYHNMKPALQDPRTATVRDKRQRDLAKAAGLDVKP